MQAFVVWVRGVHCADVVIIVRVRCSSCGCGVHRGLCRHRCGICRADICRVVPAWHLLRWYSLWVLLAYVVWAWRTLCGWAIHRVGVVLVVLAFIMLVRCSSRWRSSFRWCLPLLVFLWLISLLVPPMRSLIDFERGISSTFFLSFWAMITCKVSTALSGLSAIVAAGPVELGAAVAAWGSGNSGAASG